MLLGLQGLRHSYFWEQRRNENGGKGEEARRALRSLLLPTPTPSSLSQLHSYPWHLEGSFRGFWASAFPWTDRREHLLKVAQVVPPAVRHQGGVESGHKKALAVWEEPMRFHKRASTTSGLLPRQVAKAPVLPYRVLSETCFPL